MACSKMVGLEVRPVTSPSAIMRASRLETRSWRWMLSCHGDWPSFWSAASGLLGAGAAGTAFRLIAFSSSSGQQAERALGDVLGREAEGTHDVAAGGRRAEAVDAERRAPGPDPAVPAERDAGLHRQPGCDRGRQHAVAVVCRLLVEELPARHRDEARLDTLAGEALLGSD